MTKLITFLLLFSVSTSIFASDRFGGIWKHQFFKVENKTVRLSYKEMNVSPTYGLLKGGRIAYDIYVDVWGSHAYEELKYDLITERKSYAGKLIKDTDSHQYGFVTKEHIWLQGNKDFEHQLVIQTEYGKYRIDLNL